MRSRAGWGGSADTLKAAWREYGGVAHLWLGHRLIGGDAGFERCAADSEKLLAFLAGAEDLRRRGEAWVPLRARKPVLDPDLTWRVPASFPLPAVSVPLPPLSVDEPSKKPTG